MSYEDLHTLFDNVTDIFRKEDALVHLRSSSVMFVGDIHGNMKALDFILEMQQKIECDGIIFLGDYVDRGNDSLAVLKRLYELKLRDPQHIILLRGNHETMEMNSKYGFSDEIQDHETFLVANRTFLEMPVAAVVNDNIFCVHGGIPGPVDTGEISKENSFPYLWNDPSSINGMTASARGLRPQCFGPDIFSQFMEHNKYSLMIRAHSALRSGYVWLFNDKLLSLFSSPEYTGNKNNAAFAVLKNRKLSVIVFGKAGSEENSYSLIDADIDSNIDTNIDIDTNINE